jgi:hypothetical protein
MIEENTLATSSHLSIAFSREARISLFLIRFIAFVSISNRLERNC